MTFVLEHINPEGMHRSAVFSQGIVIPAGARCLVIGGQNGVDEAGNVVSDDLAGQAAKAIDNLVKVLEAAGGTLDDLVRVGLYVKGEDDITHAGLRGMDEARRSDQEPADRDRHAGAGAFPPGHPHRDRSHGGAGMTRTPSNRNLTRKIQQMPEFVRDTLQARGLVQAYEERPAYQRNDYLLWINGAKQDATKRKRLDQMLDELERGGVYMKMPWNG